MALTSQVDSSSIYVLPPSPVRVARPVRKYWFTGRQLVFITACVLVMFAAAVLAIIVTGHLR